MNRVLLSFILILIFIFDTSNTQLYAGTETVAHVDTNPSESIKEAKVKHNNSSEVYRDGIVDNFDNFRNLDSIEYMVSLPSACRFIEMRINAAEEIRTGTGKYHSLQLSQSTCLVFNFHCPDLGSKF